LFFTTRPHAAIALDASVKVDGHGWMREIFNRLMPRFETGLSYG
jgi:hypothetical protein